MSYRRGSPRMSQEQGERFLQLMESQTSEQLRCLFVEQKTSEPAWKLIADQLNAMPGARHNALGWRVIWSREKQYLANRLTADIPTRPIRDWELRVAAIYNWKVPPAFFSWPTETKFGGDFADDNFNADDVDGGSIADAADDSDDDADDASAVNGANVLALRQFTNEQCVVFLHSMQRLRAKLLKLPTPSVATTRHAAPKAPVASQMMNNERWSQLVGVLNVLGPKKTVKMWKTYTNMAYASVALHTRAAADDIERGMAQILWPDKYEEYKQQDFKTKKTRPAQINVLVHYLETHPYLWAPEEYNVDSIWHELADLLNLLGPAQTMEDWQKQTIVYRKNIRRSHRNQMTILERKLYDISQRPGSRSLVVLRSGRPPRVYERCGQLILTLRSAAGGGVDDDDDDDTIAIVDQLTFRCSLCGQRFDDEPLLSQHLSDTHYSIPMVDINVKCEVTYGNGDDGGVVDDADAYLHNDIDVVDNAPSPTSGSPLDTSSSAVAISMLQPKVETQSDQQPPAHIALSTGVQLAHVDAFAQRPSCDICHQNFDVLRLLRIHMKKHADAANHIHGIASKNGKVINDGNGFACDQCDVRSATRERLRWHRRHHQDLRKRQELEDYWSNNELGLPCEECGMRFPSMLKRGRHFHTVHKIPMNELTAKAATRLVSEVAFQMKTDRYRCNECGVVMNSKFKIQKHLLVHMPDLRPYLCSRCPATFRSMHNLAKHRAAQHDVGSPGLICHICGSRISSAYGMTIHLRTHRERVLDVACPECPAMFATKGGMVQHYRRTHMEVQELKCYRCDQMLESYAKLRSHLKSAHWKRAPLKGRPPKREGARPPRPPRERPKKAVVPPGEKPPRKKRGPNKPKPEGYVAVKKPRKKRGPNKKKKGVVVEPAPMMGDVYAQSNVHQDVEMMLCGL